MLLLHIASSYRFQYCIRYVRGADLFAIDKQIFAIPFDRFILVLGLSIKMSQRVKINATYHFCIRFKFGLIVKLLWRQILFN